MGKGMKVCYVNGCYNSTRKAGNNFFFIPRGKQHPIVRDTWIAFTQNLKLQLYTSTDRSTDRAIGYICDEHFRDEDFVDKTRSMLLRAAVPTLLPPPNYKPYVPPEIALIQKDMGIRKPVDVTQPDGDDVDSNHHADDEESLASNANNDFVQSVIFDHNYHNAILPTLDQFCRTCGKNTERYALVPIFTKRGVHFNIAKKISAHLKIQVTEDDGLPQQICSSCICHLNICQELVQVSQEAQIKLCNIFQVSEKRKQALTDISKENSTEISNANSSRPIDQENPFEIDYHNSEVDNTQQEIEFVENNPFEDNLSESEENDPFENAFEPVTLEDEKWKSPYETYFLTDAIVYKYNKERVDKVKVKEPESFLCELCGKNYTVGASFLRHKKTHFYVKKKYPCTECTKSFISMFYLKEHINIHKGLRPYSCTECDQKFHKESQLKKHQTTHTPGFKGEMCAICGKKFNFTSSLKHHILKHLPDRKFKCGVCKKTFSLWRSLMLHRRRHNENQDMLQEEDKENSGEQDSYLCDLCGKDFDNIHRFRRHKRVHIPDYQKKKHHCTLCTKSFESKRDLSDHMNVHNGFRPYECQDCDKKFYKRSHLYEHQKRHELAEGKDIVCKVCGRSFKTPSHLQHHNRIHNKKRHYECHICNKVFTLWGVFKSHRKTHKLQQKGLKEERRKGTYPCTICNMVFSRKVPLTNHLRTHKRQDEEYKWQCELCGDMFDTKAFLTIHTTSEHSSRHSLICQFCGEEFVSEESLVTHKCVQRKNNTPNIQIVINDYDYF